MRLKIYFSCVFMLLLLSLGVVAQAQIPPKPTPARFINDYADLLTEGQEQELENALQAFMHTSSCQIVVVTLNSLDGKTPAEMATAIGNSWGVGSKEKNNGVVVLVKPKRGESDRGQAHIATGFGMDGALPDAICFRIVENEMIPHFKEDDYYGGITEALNVVMPICRGEYSEQDYYEKHGEEDFSVLEFVFALAFLFLMPFLLFVGGVSSFYWFVIQPIIFLFKLTIGNIIVFFRRRDYRKRFSMTDSDVSQNHPMLEHLDLLKAYYYFSKVKYRTFSNGESIPYRNVVEASLLHMQQRGVLEIEQGETKEKSVLRLNKWTAPDQNTSEDQKILEHKIYDVINCLAEFDKELSVKDVRNAVFKDREEVIELRDFIKKKLENVKSDARLSQQMYVLHEYFTQSKYADARRMEDPQKWPEYMLYAMALGDSDYLFDDLQACAEAEKWTIDEKLLRLAGEIWVVALLFKLFAVAFKIEFLAKTVSFFFSVVSSSSGSGRGGGGGSSYGGGGFGGGGGGSSW